MSKTGLRGSYLLDTKTIDDVVTEKSAGAYALGNVKKKRKNEKEVTIFLVWYVGRSHDDIKKRLKGWVGGKYSRFKFEYYDSPKAAFEKECSLYHDFGKKELLDNDRHPQRPDNTSWKCPRCNIFT